MDLCRTCLKTPANKVISELEKGIKEDNKNYFEIMMFCLDIKVTEDSKITSNLCNTCYRKIISFYKFKALSLKNDAYLKSLNPVPLLENQKLSVYVDENGIKHENPLETDDYGSCIVEDCWTEIKVDTNVKDEDTLENEHVKIEEPSGDIEIDTKDDSEVSDRELLSVVQEEKEDKTRAKSRAKAVRNKRIRQPKSSKPESQMCEECGKHVRDLRQHMACHRPKGDRKMLPCKVPECPKRFFTRYGQNYHYKSAHLCIRFKCDICNKEVRNLSMHNMMSHNPSALPHGCPMCDRRYVSKSALAVHVTRHTQDHAFECDYCNKKFRAKCFLSGHIRQVHEKERKYQCEFCSKGFFKKASLQDHLRKHTKERPYKCEDCGKTFTLRDTLKSHRLIHSNEKKFACQICEKSFVKPEYLRAHMISHTKEKRYPCGFCGVRFGRSDHRNRHEFTAHKKQRSVN